MAKKTCLDMGGQAVIEGVMMKSKHYYSVAVRNLDDKIEVKGEKFISATKKKKLLGLPFIRGIITLVEMMILGLKSLSYSANIATEEEEEDSPIYMIVSFLIAIAFAIFIFKYIPLIIAQFINSKVLSSDSSVFLSLIDGIVKIFIFFLYVVLISLWSEIRTVFQYHGAEHKTVHCYEHNLKLIVKNVKKFSPIHPRCGTCFILIVLMLSIFVYSFIPNGLSLFWKLALRILLLPLIAGISYEILKLAAKFPNNLILKAMTLPGIWFQKLTTREPSDKQMEVAIKALKEVIKLETKHT